MNTLYSGIMTKCFVLIKRHVKPKQNIYNKLMPMSTQEKGPLLGDIASEP